MSQNAQKKGKPTEKECVKYVRKHGLPERIDFAMLTVYAYKEQPKGFKKPIDAVHAAIKAESRSK